MTSQIKPDFSVGGGGIVDPEFIPAAVSRELMLHLAKSPLIEGQKTSLISFANDMAQMVMDDDLQAFQTKRKQIERVASDARRLLQALKQLSNPAVEEFHAHIDYLAFGSEPPVLLDSAVKTVIKQPGGSLLASSWDYIDALEKSATYAVEQYTINNTTKPELLRARGYVSLLAEHVSAITGAIPPKDPASWFAAFVSRLGQHLDLPIGPRVVASGIKAIR